jgi:hypothetical protein
VRIIGGQWRRSLLPVADRPGLRPTPDRVRETLFNWLGQDLSGWRVVDAFAGSGALGFEAASRGAAEVLLLEQDPALVASLNASRERLKAQTLRVQRADAIAWLRARGLAGTGAAGPAVCRRSGPAGPGRRGAGGGAGGFVYLEAGEPCRPNCPRADAVPPGQAGAVHFALLQKEETP